MGEPNLPPEETAEQRNYREGSEDGAADRDPDSTRLAYGANRCNDYERGYIDSGKPAGRG